jgi:hypothetical protein
MKSRKYNVQNNIQRSLPLPRYDEFVMVSGKMLGSSRDCGLEF